MCNMDCFHCIYEDCVNEEPEGINTDEYILPTSVLDKRKRNRDRMRSVRKENPNLYKEYYARNREKEIKRNAEAKKANRDHYNTYQRERYARNREEMCRKQREYRARKKAEVS